MDKEKLKYAAINTLTAILFIGAIILALWLCTKFMWLLIPFVIIGLFIGFCYEYNDKRDEDEDDR